MRHDWRVEIIPGYQCTPEQRRAIADVLIAANSHEYPQWTPAEAADELAARGPLPLSFIALEHGIAVGCASLLDDDEVSDWEGRTWLGNVVVQDHARGRGIGSDLVDAVETHARSIGLTELHLVTLAAIDWYRAKGWRPLGAGNVHGHRMTVMSKTLL